MISMELQRDVPQYMAIPWLMTWVMARTVSVTREGETAVGGAAGGTRPSLGTFRKYRQGAVRERGLHRRLASSVPPGSEARGGRGFLGWQEKVNCNPRSQF